MRRCDGILNDSSALVSDGCDEWLTNGVAFVWVVGAVGLTVTEPGLGDAGFLVETVKLPYVTQDGLWDGMEEGSKKRERDKDAAWGDDHDQVDRVCLLDAQVGMSGEEQHAANGSGEDKENVASHSAALCQQILLLFFFFAYRFPFLKQEATPPPED